MQDAFTLCEGLVRAADRDRFLAALFAPAEHRNAVFALYRDFPDPHRHFGGEKF